MAKEPTPVKPKKTRPRPAVTLRYTGDHDVCVELDGSRHWFRPTRNDGRRVKNTHIVEAETWDKLQTLDVVAAMLAAGEVTAC